jgi:hypothetical protein
MEDTIKFLNNKISNKISLLVKDIIAKKELANLNEDFVADKLMLALEKHKKIKDKLESLEYSKFRRSKEHEAILKQVRAGLREIYGVFIQEDYKKRFELLEKLEKNPSLENHNKILALHKSSQERLPYYSLVYKKIFEITSFPKRILDLACGLNPFSYPYLGYKPEYVACDLAEKDLEFIQDYFSIMHIKGLVKKIDLTKDDAGVVGTISEGSDLVFLFKALDSLEAVKRNISEQILKSLKAKFIVVSFSTKSLGGKKTIKKQRRTWFERFVNRLGYKTHTFEIPGELFYIIHP